MNNSDYQILTVDLEGKGDFTSLTLACAYLDNSDEPTRLLINPGIYRESVVFRCSNLIIQGTGSDCSKVVITDSHYAREALYYDKCTNKARAEEADSYKVCAECQSDCKRRGTFHTAVVRTDGNNITIRNITIINSTGDGKTFGQAIALYTDGNAQLIENCLIQAHQDSLFTAPFPELNKHGVNEGFGPKGNQPRTPSTAIFRNCTVSGDVDFIFGGATVLFENCRISSLGGYVAAPCTIENLRYGYLFNKCIFESAENSSVYYLGRPWRPYGKAVFTSCIFKGSLHTAIFNDWDNKDNRSTAYFCMSEDCIYEDNNCRRIPIKDYTDSTFSAGNSDLKEDESFFGKILNQSDTNEYIDAFMDYISNFFVIF